MRLRGGSAEPPGLLNLSGLGGAHLYRGGGGGDEAYTPHAAGPRGVPSTATRVLPGGAGCAPGQRRGGTAQKARVPRKGRVWSSLLICSQRDRGHRSGSAWHTLARPPTPRARSTGPRTPSRARVCMSHPDGAGPGVGRCGRCCGVEALPPQKRQNRENRPHPEARTAYPKQARPRPPPRPPDGVKPTVKRKAPRHLRVERSPPCGTERAGGRLWVGAGARQDGQPEPKLGLGGTAPSRPAPPVPAPRTGRGEHEKALWALRRTVSRKTGQALGVLSISFHAETRNVQH